MPAPAAGGDSPGAGKKTAARPRAPAHVTLPDERGIHRQPTDSPSPALLRGGSFMRSVQLAQEQHRAELRARAQARLSNQADPAPESEPGSARLSRVNTPTRDSKQRKSTTAGGGDGGDADGAESVASTGTARSGRSAGPRPPSLLQSLAPTAAASRAGSDGGAAGLATREPTMLHTSTQLLPSPAPEKQYTVVLDLDETVIYGRDGPLAARAHLKQLLRTLDECAEVVVWTAGERGYAKAVVREINTEGVIRHLVYRDDAWFDEADYTKDLRKLGRDTDYVLIVENTPDCVRENPDNGIIVSDFEGPAGGARDETLLKLGALVREMTATGLPVPAFLRRCKMLRRQTVVTEEGREIPIRFLSGRAARRPRPASPSAADGKDNGNDDDDDDEATQKVVKKNRDKKQQQPVKAARSEAAVPAVVGVATRRAVGQTDGGDDSSSSDDDE